jgi:serine/threonine-protein kinase
MSSPTDRLDSWKEIAAHLKRDISTVQRWERKEGLPVHRHQHDKLGSVYAFRSELDTWWGQGRRLENGDRTMPNGWGRSPASWPLLLRKSATVLGSHWRLVATGVAVLTSFAVGMALGRRSEPAMSNGGQMLHTSVSIRPAHHLSTVAADRGHLRPSRRAIALSPDGRTLVFSAVADGTQQLFRALDRPIATSIAGTEGGGSPFFSPDGRWVGFWAEGKLKKVSIDGGAAVVLCQAEPAFGASWGSDGVIVFGARRGLWQVSADGGTPVLLTTPAENEFSHRQPHVLPDARAVLFTVQTRAFRWDDARIELFVRATGERKKILDGATDARYVTSGHVVYVRDAVLMAAPFDATQLRLAGGPVALRDGVMHSIGDDSEWTDTGAAQIDVSPSGSLAFVSGTVFPSDQRIPVWVDRRGNVQPLDVPARDYQGPRVSPDGTRLVVAHSANHLDDDIWVYDLKRGTSIRLTSDGGHAWPTWTPDGSRIAFYTEGAGPSNLFWQPVDASAKAERLTTSPYHQRPASWSPDGKELLFSQADPQTRGDIWVASIADKQVSLRPVVKEPFEEIFPELSPDGRWLAYSSDASGRFEVYVQPYPGPRARQVVSTAGGREAVWAKDGKRLFYREPPRQNDGAFRMMQVDITVDDSKLIVGSPTALFDDRFVRASPIRSYDIAADQRFLMLLDRKPAATAVTEIQLVLNWIDELKRKFAAK